MAKARNRQTVRNDTGKSGPRPLYAHRVASFEVFSRRLWRNGLLALALIVVALAIGMAGYGYFEGMGTIDAFVNAAMILSGMGPVAPLRNDAAKIFAGLYAIFSGLLIFAIAGLALAPLLHRILHRFHVEDDDGGEHRD